MLIDDYQTAAVRTKIYPDSAKIIYPALSLAEEAGEVAGKIGKAMRDQTPLPIEEIRKELGDLLWQIAALHDDLNLSMDVTAQVNLSKLADRAKRNVISGSGDNR